MLFVLNGRKASFQITGDACPHSGCEIRTSETQEDERRGSHAFLSNMLLCWYELSPCVSSACECRSLFESRSETQKEAPDLIWQHVAPIRRRPRGRRVLLRLIRCRRLTQSQVLGPIEAAAKGIGHSTLSFLPTPPANTGGAQGGTCREGDPKGTIQKGTIQRKTTERPKENAQPLKGDWAVTKRVTARTRRYGSVRAMSVASTYGDSSRTWAVRPPGALLISAAGSFWWTPRGAFSATSNPMSNWGFDRERPAHGSGRPVVDRLSQRRASAAGRRLGHDPCRV